MLKMLAAGAAAAMVMSVAPAATAAPAAAPVPAADGNTSLAAVLTSDGNKFDKNNKDFDILTEAVLAVLAANPSSPVSVLTDGDVALTAFAPTDRAFMHLVHSLTGKMPKTERKAFNTVASLGLPTVETVLLYHVVPGATITAKDALKANGVALTTAQGGSFTVRVHGHSIRLRDNDPNARNPRVIATDVNKGNPQIAHVIDRVLRPADL